MSSTGFLETLKDNKYLFDMGYPYYIKKRDSIVAITTDFGLIMVDVSWSDNIYSQLSIYHFLSNFESQKPKGICNWSSGKHYSESFIESSQWFGCQLVL